MKITAFPILFAASLFACTASDNTDTDTNMETDTDIHHSEPYNPLPQASEIRSIVDGFIFTEGPLWTTRGTLLFSDIPANRIHEWNGTSAEIFREPSGNSNGLLLDNEGLLLAAEHGGRRISRTQADGTVVTVIDSYQGQRLNSPNDLTIRTDGHLYFTDPPYGINESDREVPHNGVYQLTPTGDIHLIWSGDIDTRPNGAVLSPDEGTLYVSYTRENVVRAFSLDDDGTPTESRVFYETAKGPDGMTVDAHGNLYITSEAGIEVVAPNGTAWGTLAVPRKPTNCTFGGDTLYITARETLYAFTFAKGS